MTMSMRLEVRQAQSLAMTPQLLQSIRLLQYSHLDLRDFLQREADRNPLLSLADAPARARAEPPRPAGGRNAAVLAGSAWLENLPCEAPSLAAHALSEIGEALACPRERRIAEALIADLDEAGYLPVDREAAASALGVRPLEIASILERLRRAAEPAGLFAADLAECMALQLDRRGRLDPVMRTVLSRLDLVARRDLQVLSRLTGEDEPGIAEIIAELRSLDPKPGRMFDGLARQAVTPDVVVSPERGGGWRVSLDPRTLPRLIVDNAYETLLLSGCRSQEERDFVGACRASAAWLTRALDQRARSLLKVASEIVRRQEGFLRDGVGGLRPMTLAAVAEAVGLHESTVSRVTANKHMETPRGTFEMKFFFTTAIASSTGGEAHSAAGVKERIRRMVAAEGPGTVLSDDDIAARLKAAGVDLARRTVAKYREALGIASSVQRRREMLARRIAS